jgi:hypothetical protein
VLQLDEHSLILKTTPEPNSTSSSSSSSKITTERSQEEIELFVNG